MGHGHLLENIIAILGDRIIICNQGQPITHLDTFASEGWTHEGDKYNNKMFFTYKYISM